MPIFGVDVSHHQGHVDWPAARRAGVAFGICKASEGISFTDYQCAANLYGMRAAGVQRGAYHFLRAGSGAGQARHFLSVVGDPDGVLLALDVERLADPAPNARDVRDFAAELGRLTGGRRLVVYTGATFWARLTGGMDGKAAGWVLWDCGTGQHANAYVPGTGSIGQLWAKVRTAGWAGYGGWGPADRAFLQFSAAGRVPGVSGPCDVDAFFGTTAALATLAGITAAPTPTEDVDMVMVNQPGDDKRVWLVGPGTKWLVQTPAEFDQWKAAGVRYAGAALSAVTLAALRTVEPAA
jgi:GH25 family lysozyme M1 (1,4-beta-N-acetylmuramidase)